VTLDCAIFIAIQYHGNERIARKELDPHGRIDQVHAAFRLDEAQRALASRGRIDTQVMRAVVLLQL
jgi:hypothetical protein